MNKMAASTVLIIGLKGLGAEIGQNTLTLGRLISVNDTLYLH